MINLEAIGERIGYAVGNALGIFGNGIRAAFASMYGVCRKCQRPLSGASPEQVCTECHASEVLARSFGGSEGGDA